MPKTAIKTKSRQNFCRATSPHHNNPLKKPYTEACTSLSHGAATRCAVTPCSSAMNNIAIRQSAKLRLNTRQQENFLYIAILLCPNILTCWGMLSYSQGFYMQGVSAAPKRWGRDCKSRPAGVTPTSLSPDGACCPVHRVSTCLGVSAASNRRKLDRGSDAHHSPIDFHGE